MMRARVAIALALSFALAACAEHDATIAAGVAGPSDGAALGFGASGEVDPFDGDAAIAARATALLTSCRGGPETGCHGQGAAGLSMILSGVDQDVVGVRSSERPDLFRVEPYAIAQSYLYAKVRGDGGIDGATMPLGAPIDPRIGELVAEWIDAGAPLH